MQENVRASFRDPSGFVFKHKGKFYRQINQAYKSDYDLLMSSGLYEKLARSKTLLAHEEQDLALAPRPDLVYKVIKPLN